MKTKLAGILAVSCVATRMLLASDPDYKAMRAEVEALAKLTKAPKYEVVEREIGRAHV